jgi:hypothetical protein
LRKEKKKIIIPIFLVILFLGLSLSPGLNATTTTVKERQMNIRLQDVSGDIVRIKALVTHDQFEEVNNSVCEFIMYADDAMEEDSPDGAKISDSEWDQIKIKVDNFIDLIGSLVGRDFSTEETKVFVGQVINTLLTANYRLKQPVLSIGIGVTWIPFYDYETMFGKLFKPVFIHHILGFSVTLKLNPFVIGFPCLKYGLHRVRTLFFSGLLIDFADLGYKRLIGPQILIGFGFFTGFA